MEVMIIDWEGSVARTERKLKRSGLAAETFDKVFAEITLDIMRIEKQVFSSHGRRGGGSWKPLAESTVERKGHSIPLVATGELRNSVTEPGARNQILEIDNRGIIFGTTRPFAYVHQYGSKHVPRRQFIKFTANDRKRWMDMLMAHLLVPFNASD